MDHYPHSEQCEKFTLFVPVAALCTMFFVVITATHIAAICYHAERGSCSPLLLILIELVHNVSTCLFHTLVSHFTA